MKTCAHIFSIFIRKAPISLAFATAFLCLGGTANGQGNSPLAAVPAAAATPLPANTMVTCAAGIKLTFVPGANPILTAEATDGTTAPGLAVAAVHTVRFVDKQGRTVDPGSIRSTERLQPIGGSGPNGMFLQQILVDRD